MVFKGERRINRFTREICTIVDVEGVDWETKRVDPGAIVVYTLDADPKKARHRWALNGVRDVMNGDTPTFESCWPTSIVGAL